MKVLVIGGGNMGLTYAEAIAKSKFLKDRDLMILDSAKEKTEELRKRSHFAVFEKLGDCVPLADVIFIAVKPYHAAALMEDMKSFTAEGQIFISLMAGVSIEAIQEGLGRKKVVRAMPNLPAQVGMGLTSFTASDEVSRLELSTIENLLDTTGRSVHLDTEADIDASTGISGSGPAYIFYFMQSMLEAAWKMGFSKYDSRVLVEQTFAGAVELFASSDMDPESWMDRVASKGGTTRAALDSMEDNNVKELIKEAAYAAFNRAVELGEEYKNA
ncbi:pyrroline-5-carboxylate reductase [Echinicola shivajiensis]|uniref:pyrroline-5-carboxylate reductase n=1 Tax=Echinicola shivajiensis TaxID=1035916 RepID=UPI001BFC33B7|nr:pyrroline-5-carboxylate reductase [Echinicola shivajiensis]